MGKTLDTRTQEVCEPFSSFLGLSRVMVFKLRGLRGGGQSFFFFFGKNNLKKTSV